MGDIGPLTLTLVTSSLSPIVRPIVYLLIGEKTLIKLIRTSELIRYRCIIKYDSPKPSCGSLRRTALMVLL